MLVSLPSEVRFQVPEKSSQWLEELFAESHHWALLQGVSTDGNTGTALLLNRLNEVFVLDFSSFVPSATARGAALENVIFRLSHCWRAQHLPLPVSRVVRVLPAGSIPQRPDEAVIDELGDWLEAFIKGRPALEKMHMLDDVQFENLIDGLVMAHRSAPPPADSSLQTGEEYKEYFCAGCGTGVNANIAFWCRKRPERFGGKVYCAPCQGTVRRH